MDDSKLFEIGFKAFLDETIKIGKEVFTEGEKELLHLFKIGIKKYLVKQKEKFSTIKTILQGSTPVFLYDYYYPLRLIESKYVPKYHDGHYSPSRESHSICTNSVGELFQQGKYLTIMGDAGSGKSTLIKHLFLSCIREKYAIPFLLELRYLNDYSGSIEDYIVSKIFEEKIGQNAKIIERMLTNGKFVFFLDGYDEINSGIKEKIVKHIDEFVSEYRENKFVLTSRPYSNIEHFQKFKNFNVNRLNEEEIKGFIIKQLPKEKELADKIIASIKENQNQYIKSFLTNPLLLSLYILTYQSNSEIPPKKYIFYRRVIQALFSEHDSKSKIGFRRERKTDLTQEQFEDILKKFSFLTFFDSQYDFEYDYLVGTVKKIKDKLINTKFDSNKLIEDLKSALALWVEDNGVYAFAHRSMQEYYVATFVKQLDEKNNKIIYEKIIVRTGHGLTSETENLLSLCEEMDPTSFYTHYKLPLLEELRKKIRNHTDDNLVKSVICHLLKEINIDFNQTAGSKQVIRYSPYHGLELNNEVHKYLFFHLKFMQKIHEIMAGFKNYVSNTNKTKTKRFRFILDETDFPEEVLNYCRSKDVPKIINELQRWLDSEIQKTKDFVDKTSRSNDELVSMI